MARPVFTYDTALETAIRLARADEDEDSDTMSNFVYSTSGTVGENAHYRPYEAAASFLESDPDSLEKAKQGITFANRERVVASLRQTQLREDIAAGYVQEGASSAPAPFVVVV